MAAIGIPDDDDLYRIMEQSNPWWAGGRIQDGRVREFRRPEHAELMRRMGEHPVQAVLGARQVGKTALLYQVVADLVAANDPRRVMFLPLGEFGLFPSADNLRRMLDLYGIRTLGESMCDLGKRTYVVLDEVQAVPNWQKVARAAVDRGGPLRLIVAGSPSAGALRGSEPLAGKMRRQTMAPMSFCESLAFRNHRHAGAAAKAGKGLRRALAESVEKKDPTAFHDSARDAMLELAPAQDGLGVHLFEYMLYGGCPGIVASSDPVHKAGELKRTMKWSMYNDVVKAGSIRNPRVLEDLFYMLAEGSPRLIDKGRMQRMLGINKATLNAYLCLLEATHLLSYSHAYSSRTSGSTRARRKAYVCDVGVRNAVVSMSDARMLTDPAKAGMLAETVACSHTRRLWETLDHAATSHMPHYWRTGGGDEVDLVMSPRGMPVPIEVKYRQHVESSDLKGLLHFVDKFKPGVALALVQDSVRLVGDSTVAIPLWLYLVMCG